jgi:hypothetical protein
MTDPLNWEGEWVTLNGGIAQLGTGRYDYGVWMTRAGWFHLGSFA